MYWLAALILFLVAIAFVGLIGIWPLAIPAVLIGVGLIILAIMSSGREGSGSVSAIDRPEPTGIPRAPSGEQRGSDDTANERTGQD